MRLHLVFRQAYLYKNIFHGTLLCRPRSDCYRSSDLGMHCSHTTVNYMEIKVLAETHLVNKLKMIKENFNTKIRRPRSVPLFSYKIVLKSH